MLLSFWEERRKIEIFPVDCWLTTEALMWLCFCMFVQGEFQQSVTKVHIVNWAETAAYVPWKNMDILRLYFQCKSAEIFHLSVQLFSQWELFFWNVLTFTHLGMAENERRLSNFWGLKKALNWMAFSKYLNFTAFANYSTIKTLGHLNLLFWVISQKTKNILQALFFKAPQGPSLSYSHPRVWIVTTNSLFSSEFAWTIAEILLDPRKDF